MHTDLHELLAARQVADPSRYDLYGGIHKALRMMLADLLGRAGRVDPDDDGSRRALVDQVEHVAAFCVAHLEHENAFIHPVLERVQPGSSRRIALEHDAHLRDIEALRRHGRALIDCPPDDRRAACRTLYHGLSLFTAHNLVHMYLEETDHQAALWANCRDDDLAAIEGRIVGSLSPQDMATSMRWMIPSTSPAERLALLTGVRDGAPPEVFEAVVGIARGTLPEGDRAVLMRALGLPAVPGLAF